MKAAILTLLLFGAPDRGLVRPEAVLNVSSVENGDYLREDTIRAIDATLSTIDTKNDEAFVVRRDGEGQVLSFIENFHEGGAAYVLDKSGKISIDFPMMSMDRQKGVKRFTFTKGQIEVEYLSGKREVFRHVGDFGRYVGAKVLIGKYRDVQGKLYEFRPDGTAVFPKTSFKWTVGVDLVLNPFDYFMVPGTEMVVGYRRTAEELDLFATFGEISQEVSSVPYLRLMVERAAR